MSRERNVVVRTYVRSPFSWILNILAVLVSWFYNHSVLWAIFHYIFGPLYLLYSLLIGRFADGGFTKIMEHYF